MRGEDRVISAVSYFLFLLPTFDNRNIAPNPIEQQFARHTFENEMGICAHLVLYCSDCNGKISDFCSDQLL